MEFRWDGDFAVIRLAPDEQRALKLLSERMYLDDAEVFVQFSSFRWSMDGAGIFRTLKSIGGKLKEEPEEAVVMLRRRRDDPPSRDEERRIKMRLT